MLTFGNTASSGQVGVSYGRFTLLPRLEIVDGRIISLPRVILDMGLGRRMDEEDADTDDEASVGTVDPPLYPDLDDLHEKARDESVVFVRSVLHAGAA